MSLAALFVVLAGIAVSFPHAFFPGYWRPYFYWIGLPDSGLTPSKRLTFTLKTEEAEKKLEPWLSEVTVDEETGAYRFEGIVFSSSQQGRPKEYEAKSFGDLFRHVDGRDVSQIQIMAYGWGYSLEKDDVAQAILNGNGEAAPMMSTATFDLENGKTEIPKKIPGEVELERAKEEMLADLRSSSPE